MKWFQHKATKETRQKSEEEIARNRAAAERELIEGRDRLARLVEQMKKEKQA